jgi:hypothetical protein
MRARNRMNENSLSNGALLWWGAALLDGLLAFVRHSFWGFLFWSGGEDVK